MHDTFIVVAKCVRLRDYESRAMRTNVRNNKSPANGGIVNKVSLFREQQTPLK
jgi:hypothetical protein